MSNVSHSYLLVLRGQPFRGNVADATPQLRSYVEMLVEPLRRGGHAVDVAIAASEDKWLQQPDVVRKFRSDAEQAFGARALVQFVAAPTNNQADGVRLAMQTLHAATSTGRTYDAYVMSRLDMLLRVDVTRWNCSLTERVNFVSECHRGAKLLGCVNDVLITIPRVDVAAFASGVNRPAVAGCDCVSEARSTNGCKPFTHPGCFDDWNLPQTHNKQLWTNSSKETSALTSCRRPARRYSGHGCLARIAPFLSERPSFCMRAPHGNPFYSGHVGYTLLREGSVMPAQDVS